MSNNGIYLEKQNKYGFRLNINHPRINELYRRFKEWKSLPANLPLDNEQRLEFENYVLQTLKK